MKHIVKIISLAFSIILVTGLTSVQATEPAFVVDRIGSFGTDPGEFNVPSTVLFLNGNYYVSEEGGDRVQIFDEDWTYLDQFGGSGAGNGQLDLPAFMGTNGTHIFVSEFNNDRISVFNLDGGFLTSFGSPGNLAGEFSNPHGIAFDDGRMFVSDSANSRIQVFNESTLEYITSLFGASNPRDMEIIGDVLYVVDRTLEQVLLYNVNSYAAKGAISESGVNPGQLNQPYGMAYQDGLLFVASLGNDAVSVFDTAGRFVTDIRADLRNPAMLEIDEKYMYVPSAIADELVVIRLVAEPRDLIIREGAGTLTLSWDITISEGVLEPHSYNIYRDSGNGSEFLGRVLDTVFTDTTPQQGTNYTYQVQAVAQGGVSEMVNSSPVTSTGSPAVTVTEEVTVTEVETGESGGFDVPVNILPFLSALLLIPLLRKSKK